MPRTPTQSFRQRYDALEQRREQLIARLTAQPGLLLSSTTLYGTACCGGNLGLGTVFTVNTNGTGFTNLVSYFGPDGYGPSAGVILSGNTLYGTTSGDEFGFSPYGVVFAVGTAGAGFTSLHSFTGGSDGSNPLGGLVLSGNTLYGTASQGGYDNGTVFAINVNGTGFTNLHSFNISGSEGVEPLAGLILMNNTLYGTTAYGGSSDSGTVFAINTNGTGFMTLYGFTGGDDGATPYAGLLLSGHTLYGTALYGGSSGNGTVFSLSVRPQLAITCSGTNVILSWPTNVAGFDYTGYTLQSTTNLFSQAAWVTNSPAPVVIAGQNTVTHPLSGARRFFRLISN